MLKLAIDVDRELRTNVIQAREKGNGIYGKYSASKDSRAAFLYTPL